MTTRRRASFFKLAVALTRDLLGGSRLLVAAAIALMMLSSAASGAAVLALVPLLAAAGVPLAGERVPDGWLGTLMVAGGAMRLEAALAIYVGLAAIVAALAWAQSAVGAALTQRVAHRLRLRALDALLAAEWPVVSRRRASDVQESLTRGVERAGLAAHDLLTFASAATFVAMSIALAAAVSPGATALACVAGAALTLPLGARKRRAPALGEALTGAERGVHREISETVHGLKLIRVFGMEGTHRRRLARASRELGAANVRLASQPALVRGVFDVGAAIAMAVVIFVALRALRLPASALLVLVLLFLRLMPRVSTMQTYFQSLLAELPAYEAVRALITELTPPPVPADSTREMLEPLRADITVERVTAGYGGVPVLRDVSVRIAAGTTVALVGPSGAGKTTLADVLLGLVPATSGRVLIDGTPLTAATGAAWRAQVAAVPQEVFLFHDTVRANLAWAAPDAAEDDMWGALEAAAAAAFVRALPAGLDTVVGDRGHLVSGGERQRLALARALLRSPRVIVLDEATSALDHENEQIVQRAIERLGGAVTLVVIAHRLSSIRRADRIVVLDAGRVVEDGTWMELMSRPHGRFRRMCDEPELPEWTGRPAQRS